jgi:hypothetical protein
VIEAKGVGTARGERSGPSNLCRIPRARSYGSRAPALGSASAIVSAASAAFRSVTPPKQKPWLIVTLPPRPSAFCSMALGTPLAVALERWTGSRRK